jgi:hypothetical protein
MHDLIWEINFPFVGMVYSFGFSIAQPNVNNKNEGLALLRITNIWPFMIS